MALPFMIPAIAGIAGLAGGKYLRDKNKRNKKSQAIVQSNPPESRVVAPSESRYNYGVNPEELRSKAFELLARDSARLAGTNYPSYRGEKTSPMSSLTQRQRELASYYGAKPPSYSGKISSVLNRDNQGITPENIQTMLAQLQGDQRNLGSTVIGDILKQEFKSAFAPRENRFNYKINKDIDRYSPEIQSNLSDISRASSSLEGSRNREIVRSLQGLQKNKEIRKADLLSALERFGNQKHGYNNLVNDTNRAQFKEEALAPYKRMGLLAEALGRGGEGETAMSNQADNSNLIQALRAYGVDPSSLESSWDKRSPSIKYPGELISSLPIEIETSGRVLEGIKPSLRDEYTDTRKTLTRNLLDTPSISAKVLESLPTAMRGKIEMLESEAKNRAKEELARLNNQYIRLGQYGSTQHLRDAEKKARDLAKATLESRNKILQNTLTSQLGAQHEEEIGNIRRLDQVGTQGHRNFGSLMKNIEDMNRIGSTKFANNQKENEDTYEDFLNEQAWQWPHLRPSVMTSSASSRGRGVGTTGGRASAIPSVFNDVGSRNIDLDNIANLNTSYNELQPEARTAPPIATAQEARTALQATNNLAQEQARREQERRAQEQARREQERRVQEQARRAQEQRAEVERDRLRAKNRQIEDFRRQVSSGPDVYYDIRQLLRDVDTVNPPSEIIAANPLTVHPLRRYLDGRPGRPGGGLIGPDYIPLPNGTTSDRFIRRNRERQDFGGGWYRSYTPTPVSADDIMRHHQNVFGSLN